MTRSGVARACTDNFMPYADTRLVDTLPDRASLTRIRQRVPEVAHNRMFARVLVNAHDESMLTGATIGLDVTILEANEAIRAIVGTGTGEYHNA